VTGLMLDKLKSLQEKPAQKQPVKTKVPSSKIPERFKDTPAKLSTKLGTKVNLKRNNNGEGSIVISFKNDKDLDKIISLIED